MSENFIYRPVCELCQTKPTILFSRPYTHPSVWDFLDNYYEGRIEKAVLSDAVYEIAQCSQCGFIWQAYILNDTWMEVLYDTWISAEGSLKKKQSMTIIPGYQRQAELIRVLRPEIPAGQIDVLDFGMGWGYWCMAAKPCGYHIVGLEVSPTRVQFAREKGLEVVQSLAEVGSQKFDFINAEQVFEHIPQPLETLKTLARHLKAGGVIRIAVPDGKGMASELQKPSWKASKSALHPLEHINCFTHQTLKLLGDKAGLDVIPQPVLLSRNYKTVARQMAARFYRQFFDTVLYFRAT